MMKKVLHRASSVDGALVKDDGPVGVCGGFDQACLVR